MMGAFAIYNDCDTDSTVISNLFIDEYMKDANEAQIKIYLYLVRMMSAGRSTTIADMADLFNHTEKEVLRSLHYWEKQGLLSLQCDHSGRLVSVHLCDLKSASVPAVPGESVPSSDSRVISIEPMLRSADLAAKTPSGSGVPVPSAARRNITEPMLQSFRENNEMQQLLLVIEQYIGKPLSVNDLKTVYYIHEELQFSGDLIDYLVSYCVGLGKRDFRYIEKVAVNWASEGSTTTKDAKLAASRGGTRARKKSLPASGSRANSFNCFAQNRYDFSELEKQLLRN